MLATLGGHVALRNRSAQRSVAARDFFTGPMMTAMTHGDCIVAVHFPVWRQGRIGVGFQEVSARRSDFALASAAAQVALDPSGQCTACALGIGGAAATPIRLDAVDALIGSHLSDRDITEAVRAAVASIEIMSSSHASDDYRRRAAATLGARALMQARDAARGSTRQ